MEQGRGGALVIRPGEPGDIDALLALEWSAFSGDRLSRRSLRGFLKSPLRPVIVAAIGDALAGYALVAIRKGGCNARVYSLAVDPRFARRGVGRALLQACENYASARRRAALTLEVRYDNAPAIALYESLGYRAFGEHADYYDDGAAALRYAKPLIDRAAPPTKKSREQSAAGRRRRLRRGAWPRKLSRQSLG